MKNKLGQNFLTDKNIAKREIEYAEISNKDTVLEIGPGKGILTNILAEKAKKVIAIEYDKDLISNLERILPENVELIHGDAVRIDFNTLTRFNKVVSNLPFQISSKITFKLLNYSFDIAVLIYQKEFASRMIANAGTKDYSRLSVNVYYRAYCDILGTIPKSCFNPTPKVDSCIVKLTPREKPAFYVIDENFFFEFTRNLFNNRRKKINTILHRFYDINIDEISFRNNRAEELTPEQLGELCNIIFTSLNS